MKKLFGVVCVLGSLSLAAVAQDSLKVAQSLVAGRAEAAQVLTVPAGCSPCLWYSGDLDPKNSLSNGEFNANDESAAIAAQVMVPFSPTSDGDAAHKHVNVTSITFNELSVGAPDDLDGGTYEFKTLVSAGNPGVGKPAACESVSAVSTGRSFAGYVEYSYTCSLKKAVKLTIGTNYWVSMLPTFTAGNYAYVSDVEDMPAPNQYGWGNITYNTFITSSYFSVNYAPTWGSAGTCGGSGCDQFSVALGGTYVP